MNKSNHANVPIIKGEVFENRPFETRQDSQGHDKPFQSNAKKIRKNNLFLKKNQEKIKTLGDFTVII